MTEPASRGPHRSLPPTAIRCTSPSGRRSPPARGQVVVLHGVQSHGGWYHRLGRTLAAAGYIASFPDRRGSGANQHGSRPCPIGAPADLGSGRVAARLSRASSPACRSPWPGSVGEESSR